jgi:metal-responsive CopG/Arc/MetJ family transcriptional regulator
MIMVRGKAPDIRHLFDHMRQEKGVLHSSISLGTLGGQLG